jgi:hypothetical protein
VADPGVIDAYVAQLGGLLGSRHAERIAAEVRDHLWECAEHLMGAGRSPEDAERAAIDAFGDPSDLAEEFNDQGGAMPSPFTRWAGLAGMLGVITLAVGLATIPETKPGEIDPPPNVLAFVSLGLLVLGLAALIVRTRGAFGRARGVLATVLIVAGMCLVPVGYGIVGWAAATMLIVGFGVLFDVIFREAVLPRPATALFAVSLVALSLMAPTSLEKQSWPYYVGGALMVVGWLWLHYTLWSERPTRVEVVI